MNYYLIIKKDNNLRNFILLHLVKLINLLKNIIEERLYSHINKFKFVDSDDNYLKKLTHDLAEKETELLNVNPEKLSENTDVEILTTDNIKSTREEILDELKNANPELETDNWI